MKLLKKTIAVLFCNFIILSVHAQFNYAGLNNQHTQSLNAVYLPSMLGCGVKNVDIYTGSFYGAAANNFLKLDKLAPLFSGQTLDASFVDNLLSNIKKDNKIYVGADIQLINAIFQVRRKKMPFLTFGLGATERAHANINMNNNLLKLLYAGNKQFVGQTINLLPNINILYYHDYHVSMAASIPLTLRSNFITVKPVNLSLFSAYFKFIYAKSKFEYDYS